jgi:hypothetical protein
MPPSSSRLKRFADYDFAQGEFEFVKFNPEIVAVAIEELGYQFALKSGDYERAKNDAERIASKLTGEYRKIAGSVSGARSMAEVDEEYQEALQIQLAAEVSKIKAQSSFRSAEAYSRMIITKVSSESKIAEYYKKNLNC